MSNNRNNKNNNKKNSNKINNNNNNNHNNYNKSKRDKKPPMLEHIITRYYTITTTTDINIEDVILQDKIFIDLCRLHRLFKIDKINWSTSPSMTKGSQPACGFIRYVDMETGRTNKNFMTGDRQITGLKEHQGFIAKDWYGYFSKWRDCKILEIENRSLLVVIDEYCKNEASYHLTLKIRITFKGRDNTFSETKIPIKAIILKDSTIGGSQETLNMLEVHTGCAPIYMTDVE
jgi:hypothetical protein